MRREIRTKFDKPREKNMSVINELKKLMLNIGVEERIVNEVGPDQTLAKHVLDSVDYTAFIVAIEERYGIKVTDRYALKLRTLNDFKNYINAG
jgi:acyl carrier protein